jgi:hypothetical protein
VEIMFCKLNTTFEKPLYIVTEGLKTFTGIDEDGEKKGIDYKKIWSPDAEKLLSVIPTRYWDDFHLTVMTINRAIPPHTDTEIITTINFYIETGGARTVFYDPAVDNPRTVQIENQTDGYIYYLEDLKEVGSFIAKDLEVWCLDVKKIHAVEGNVSLRKAITLGTFKHKYEDVVEMFKETGCLPS